MSCIREEIVKDLEEVVKDAIDSCDWDTDRVDLIERFDEEVDTVWERHVGTGRIDQMDVEQVADTAQLWAAVLALGKDYKCIETDRGLWEGLSHSAPVSQAYFTLRNLLNHIASEDFDVDVNEDHPLVKAKAKSAVEGMDDVHVAYLAGFVYNFSKCTSPDSMTDREGIIEAIVDSNDDAIYELIDELTKEKSTGA